MLAQRARRRRDGDDDLVGLHAVEDSGQVRCAAEHLDAGDAHALLARVVVDEAHRGAAQTRVAAQLECNLLAAVAGTDDQDLVRRPLQDRAARGALDDRANGEARAAHEHEREQEVEREHATRRVVLADREQEQHDDQADRRDDHGLEDRLEVLLIDEAPELRIEPEHREDHELHRDGERDRVPEQLLVPLRDPRVEAEDVGEVVGEREQARVDADLSQAAGVHGGGHRSHRSAAESRSVTSSRGSRRTRNAPCSERLLHAHIVGIGEPTQAAIAEQRLVHSAEPALEGREHGRPECHGLAVHGASGRDHQIGVGDETLRVHGVLGHDERTQTPHLLALLARPGQHHHLGITLSESLEHSGEQRVLEAVVERHVGRRPHHDERALTREPELPQHRLVRLEVRQVVLLLQPLVAAQLARLRAVARQPLGRDQLRHHDHAAEAAVHVVLLRGELVVERRGRRDPQQRRGHAHVVRAVPDRHVEAAARAPSAQARRCATRGRRPWRRAARRGGARSPCDRCRSARTARASGRSRAR